MIDKQNTIGNPEIYLMYNKYLVYSKDVTAKYQGKILLLYLKDDTCLIEYPHRKKKNETWPALHTAYAL